MITVRWVRGEEEKTTTRDQSFETRRAALEVIARQSISSIRRLGRLYIVGLKEPLKL